MVRTLPFDYSVYQDYTIGCPVYLDGGDKPYGMLHAISLRTTCVISCTGMSPMGHSRIKEHGKNIDL